MCHEKGQLAAAWLLVAFAVAMVRMREGAAFPRVRCSVGKRLT